MAERRMHTRLTGLRDMRCVRSLAEITELFEKVWELVHQREKENKLITWYRGEVPRVLTPGMPSVVAFSYRADGVLTDLRVARSYCRINSVHNLKSVKAVIRSAKRFLETKGTSYEVC